MKPRGMNGSDLECAVTIKVHADIAIQEDTPEAIDESTRGVAPNGSGTDTTQTMNVREIMELHVEGARARVGQPPRDGDGETHRDGTTGTVRDSQYDGMSSGMHSGSRDPHQCEHGGGTHDLQVHGERNCRARNHEQAFGGDGMPAQRMNRRRLRTKTTMAPPASAAATALTPSSATSCGHAMPSSATPRRTAGLDHELKPS